MSAFRGEGGGEPLMARSPILSRRGSGFSISGARLLRDWRRERGGVHVTYSRSYLDHVFDHRADGASRARSIVANSVSKSIGDSLGAANSVRQLDERRRSSRGALARREPA
jgi:hypothetical protein